MIRQLAGDLLRETEAKKADDNLIATQMLVLNLREMDPIEGVVEVVGQQFLGLSLNCAKCHDHKFDAFSQQDYYALAGMFTSTTLAGKKKAARGDQVELRSEKGMSVLAVRDDTVADTNLLLKGDPRQKGNVVSRRLPVVLAGERQEPIARQTKDSGRLELAVLAG